MHALYRITAAGFFGLCLLVAFPVITRACDDVSFVISSQLLANGPSLNVLTADFNNDSHPDLAVTNDSQVVVFLNDGAGGFDPAVTYDAGHLPRAMAVGDLDNDGRTDLIVADVDDISVLLNNGAGGFKAPITYTAGQGPNSIGTGDFNGDGNTDVAVVNRESDNVTILLGDGTGGLDSVVNFPAGEFPLDIAIGDYDEDGRLDLAISTYTSQEILILKGDGMGGFTTINSYPLGGNATRIIAGDFNNDHHLDLAVGVYNIGPANHVAVFLGNGDGTFSESSDIFAPDPQGLTAADFDGDGNLDIACTSYYVPSIVVALGDGTGDFGPARKTRLPRHPYPFDIVAADFNGDGKPDLAISNYDSKNASILFNEPTVEIEAIDPSASKCDHNKGHIDIHRNGCLEQPLVVNYTVSGTAIPGVDYQALPGTATIPANVSFFRIPIIPIGQTCDPESETVILTLDPDPNFAIGQESSATVTISNN